MAIDPDDITIVALGPGVVRATWESDLPDPTFYLYRDGKHVSTQIDNSATIAFQPDDAVTIEVFDDPDERPTYGNTTRNHLEFTRSSDAMQYRVERFDGAEWQLHEIIDDAALESYRSKSAPLDDVTNVQYRVTPIADNHEAGTATTATVYTARRPDAPDVDFEYDEGSQKVTISAGA